MCKVVYLDITSTSRADDVFARPPLHSSEQPVSGYVIEVEFHFLRFPVIYFFAFLFLLRVSSNEVKVFIFQQIVYILLCMITRMNSNFVTLIKIEFFAKLKAKMLLLFSKLKKVNMRTACTSCKHSWQD